MPGLDRSRLALLLMAGGSGTRLWPQSRKGRGKQFTPLTFGKTLLELTYERGRIVVPPERIFVNVTDGNAHWIRQLLPEVPPNNIIVAPEDRDTLPTLGYATLAIERAVSDPTLLLLASDNWIDNAEALSQTMLEAATGAQAGPYLVSIGIAPTYASTQYGYMHTGTRRDDIGEHTYAGLGYVEKPEASLAEELFRRGDHDWNSGMFAWRAATFWSALRAFVPEEARIFEALREISPTDRETTRRVFSTLRHIAVDHGLLERVGPKTQEQHLFVRAKVGWDDVGHYDALARYMQAAPGGSRVHGSVSLRDAHDCTIFAAEGTQVVVEGLRDLIVSADGGDVLVAARSSYPKVRTLATSPIAMDGATHRVHGFVRFVGAEACDVETDGEGVVALVDVARIAVRSAKGEVTVRPITALDRADPAESDSRGLPPIAIGEDHESAGQLAARFLVETLKESISRRGKAVAILSAGRTPGPVYAALRTSHRDSVDWRRVTLVQMDEYVGLPEGSTLSFEHFLREQLVVPLNLEFRPMPREITNDDLRAYEARVAAEGLDVILHGIGRNGHLGFNEPGSAFDGHGGVVNLAEQTRADAAPTFGGLSATPVSGATFGLALLSTAKRVLLLACGAAKGAAIRRTFLEPASSDLPASSLQSHPDVHVFLDIATARGLLPHRRET